MGYLNARNILDYAFINLDTVQKPIRGVVMNCHGMDDETVYDSSPRPGVDLGNEGVLYIFPYYGPWAWCNDQTVFFLNEILDAVWEMLRLPEDLPYVLVGGSMGGLTAMLYSMYGNRRPLAVGCNCPVCDLAAVFEASPQMRRSIYSAYVGSGLPFEEELDRHNPILQTSRLPDIPYLIVSGSMDVVISEEGQIGPFQQAMLQAGKRATFMRVPGMGHCNIMEFEDAYQTYLHFCLRHLGLQA